MPLAPDVPDANIRASFCYLLSAVAACRYCGLETKVYALAVPAGHYCLHAGDEEEADDAWQAADAPAVLFHIAALSAAIILRLGNLVPGFRASGATTSNASRWTNHCDHCGAVVDDDDLHCEPEAAFLPISPAAARMLRLTEIREPIQVSAAASAPGAHWLALATRD